MSASTPERVPLGALVSITRGKTYKSRLLGQTGPVLLGLSSIARNGGFRGDSLRTYGGDSPEDLLVRPGEIFASLKDVTQSADLLGSVARVPEHIAVGRLTQDTVRLDVVAANTDRDYLYYSLLTPAYRSFCRSHATGTTTLGLPREDFLAYEIPLPPLWEQKRIVDVLRAFDDLIETNRQLADQLDFTRQIKLSGALSSSAEKTKLTDVASFVNGRNFTKGADGIGRPVIRTPEVRSGPGGNTVWSSVQAEHDRIARVGDILFVWSGTLMVNRWLHAEGLVNQHVFKVIPHGFPDWYVFGLIEAQLPWFLGLAKDKATTMGHIKRADLDEPMSALNAETIAELDSLIGPIWLAALELRMEALELARQRDELLPLLMSGEVRVRDLEAVA